MLDDIKKDARERMAVRAGGRGSLRLGAARSGRYGDRDGGRMTILTFIHPARNFRTVSL